MGGPRKPPQSIALIKFVDKRTKMHDNIIKTQALISFRGYSFITLALIWSFQAPPLPPNWLML